MKKKSKIKSPTWLRGAMQGRAAPAPGSGGLRTERLHRLFLLLLLLLLSFPSHYKTAQTINHPRCLPMPVSSPCASSAPPASPAMLRRRRGRGGGTGAALRSHGRQREESAGETRPRGLSLRMEPPNPPAPRGEGGRWSHAGWAALETLPCLSAKSCIAAQLRFRERLPPAPSGSRHPVRPTCLSPVGLRRVLWVSPKLSSLGQGVHCAAEGGN